MPKKFKKPLGYQYRLAFCGDSHPSSPDKSQKFTESSSSSSPALSRKRRRPDKFQKLIDSPSSSLAASHKRRRPADPPPPFHQTAGNTATAPEDLSPFVSHCSFLPLDYDFTKEELLALWMAEGLLPDDRFYRLDDFPDETIHWLVSEELIAHESEDFPEDAFYWLVSKDLIVSSRLDKTVDYLNPAVRKRLYKVNESVPTTLGHQQQQHARVSNDNMDHVPETVLHLSVVCENVDRIEGTFDALKRFKLLKTLFLVPSFGFSVERIPSDMFLWLKHLRALNLSRNLLSELPVSIGNLKLLRHLDLSYTPIKQLPDTIDTLRELQTLKLRCCFNLVGLPKGMRKLTNLRHLDVDVIRQIKSMPPGMGNLSKLQTLSAFLVGRSDGCGIEELKNMGNLTGTFCISRLENVSDFKEAKDANLIDKRFLKKLELRWTDMTVRVANDTDSEEDKILEHLQPPLQLEELSVLNYCGSKLPSWIDNSSYGFLFDITLSSCRNCQLLPSLGELPSLKFLHVKEMNELKRIDHSFGRKGEHQYHGLFPKLEKLTIEVMPKLVEWIGVQHSDFPLLQKLKVEHCPKLILLPFRSHLYSLKHLELCYCPNITSLPDKDVIDSLEFLLIKDCPELKRRCNKGRGQDWIKIAHVPNILLDDERIT